MTNFNDYKIIVTNAKNTKIYENDNFCVEYAFCDFVNQIVQDEGNVNYFFNIFDNIVKLIDFVKCGNFKNGNLKHFISLNDEIVNYDCEKPLIYGTPENDSFNEFLFVAKSFSDFENITELNNYYNDLLFQILGNVSKNFTFSVCEL